MKKTIIIILFIQSISLAQSTPTPTATPCESPAIGPYTVGENIRINDSVAGDQRNVSLARDTVGNLYVVWHDNENILMGNILDPSGADIVSDFQVATAGYYGYRNGIDASPNGTFVVSWGDGNSLVKAKRFNSLGLPTSSIITVSSANSFFQSVLTKDDGHFRGLWANATDSKTIEYDSDALPIRSTVTIPQATGSAMTQLSNNNIIYTYQKGNDIAYIMNDRFGINIIPETIIDNTCITPNTCEQLNIVHDSNDYTMIIWMQLGAMLHFAIIDPAGHIAVNKTQVPGAVTGTFDDLKDIGLAANADAFLIAWVEGIPGMGISGIFATRVIESGEVDSNINHITLGGANRCFSDKHIDIDCSSASDCWVVYVSGTNRDTSLTGIYAQRNSLPAVAFTSTHTQTPTVTPTVTPTNTPTPTVTPTFNPPVDMSNGGLY